MILNRILNWINFERNSNIELNQFGYRTGLHNLQGQTIFVQSVKLKFFADQDCDVSLESWRCNRYTGSCRDASSKIKLFCESTQMKEIMNNLCKSTVLKYIAIYLGSLSPTLLWPCPPFIGILSHSFIASQWYIHLQGVLALCLSEIPDHLNPTHL